MLKSGWSGRSFEKVIPVRDAGSDSKSCGSPAVSLQAASAMVMNRRHEGHEGVRKNSRLFFRTPSCPSCLLFITMALAACNDTAGEPQLFESLPASRTGITFSNDLPDQPDFNILNYLYYYDGGGV